MFGGFGFTNTGKSREQAAQVHKTIIFVLCLFNHLDVPTATFGKKGFRSTGVECQQIFFLLFNYLEFDLCCL